MSARNLPENVAAAIRKCWRDGVVEEFATDESYFQEVHARFERDLRKIRGASLIWQTENVESGGDWDDDWDDEEDEPALREDWQSYHAFFLAADGKEFQFEDETVGVEEADDPEEKECIETTYPGEGWVGFAVFICLAVPVAFMNLCSYSQYEDGSASTPDPESFLSAEMSGERVDASQSYRESLGEKGFQKLEVLRGKIALVLEKHRIQLLDNSVLNLHVPRLKADGDVFLEEPLRVLHAFFFRGV